MPYNMQILNQMDASPIYIMCDTTEMNIMIYDGFMTIA